MARKVGYLYKTEKGIDDAKLATRITLGVNLTTGEQLIGAGRTVFAKVVALRAGTDDKQATAVTVVYNATTRAFETDDDLIFNSDSATADRTTTDIFSSEAMTVDQVLKIIPYGDSSESEQWMAEQSGAGSSLIYLTTDNAGLSFNDGAKYDRPGGTGTALTVSDTYYIATPWNTRIVAPANHFGYFVQDGTDWYKSIIKFYVKPSMNYPAGAGTGITTFTCYMDKADTSLNLGTNTAFPTNIKCLSKVFDSANAGTNSLNYWNGRLFEASYDTGANIIYLDHPSF